MPLEPAITALMDWDETFPDQITPSAPPKFNIPVPWTFSVSPAKLRAPLVRVSVLLTVIAVLVPVIFKELIVVLEEIVGSALLV
jgi:hypothetical protein